MARKAQHKRAVDVEETEEVVVRQNPSQIPADAAGSADENSPAVYDPVRLFESILAHAFHSPHHFGKLEQQLLIFKKAPFDKYLFVPKSVCSERLNLVPMVE